MKTKILLYHTAPDRYITEFSKIKSNIELYTAKKLIEAKRLPLSEIKILIAWKFPSECVFKLRPTRVTRGNTLKTLTIQ